MYESCKQFPPDTRLQNSKQAAVKCAGRQTNVMFVPAEALGDLSIFNSQKLELVSQNMRDRK